MTVPLLWPERKVALDLADGRRLAFVRAPAEGPALLMIHGFTDTSRSYSELASLLPRFDRVIPDMPGHGASAPSPVEGIAGFTDDMVALLDHLGIDEVSIVGHSMGGAIGIDLAVRLGARARALIILASSLTPCLPVDSSIGRAITGFSDPIDPADPFFDEWYACNRPVDPDFLAVARREAAAMPAAVWRSIYQGLAVTNLTDHADAVACPVLCVSGTADPLFDRAHQKALSVGFADCVSVTQPGQGHNLHWEEPECIADLIGDFLADALEN